jgi:hypothetical protein
MASAYFLNAQPEEISITLNSGATKVLGGLADRDGDPSCELSIKALPAKNVLGLNGINRLAVTTRSAGDTVWTIQLDTNKIRPNFDIQFLVFANQVVGRQGIQTEGFRIVQTAGPKMAQPSRAKQRNPATRR